MSVPTLVSVSPAIGRTTGGNLVQIVGTNFRVPDAPPATGYLGGAQPRTVKVSFGGVVSEWAYAASSSLILARVPTWIGAYDITWPAAVVVRVANLDDDEVEIPTENVSRTDGYTYQQPSFATEPYLQWTLRQLVKLFRRHIGVPVWLTLDQSYTDSPADQDRLRASAPVIHLVGPSAPLNRFDSVNYEDPIDDPTNALRWLQTKEPVTVDLAFEVQAFAPSTRQLLALGQAFTLFQRDIVELIVPDDPALPNGDSKKYELKCPFEGLPDYNTEPAAAGLFSWGARIMIIGVQIDEVGGTVIRRGWRVTNDDGDPSTNLQTL